MQQQNTGRVDRRAVAAATVTVVLWASAFVSIRSAGAEYGPGALALGRLLSGTVVLGALWLIRREACRPGPPGRASSPLASCGSAPTWSR